MQRIKQSEGGLWKMRIKLDKGQWESLAGQMEKKCENCIDFETTTNGITFCENGDYCICNNYFRQKPITLVLRREQFECEVCVGCECPRFLNECCKDGDLKQGDGIRLPKEGEEVVFYCGECEGKGYCAAVDTDDEGDWGNYEWDCEVCKGKGEIKVKVLKCKKFTYYGTGVSSGNLTDQELDMIDVKEPGDYVLVEVLPCK